VPDPAAAAEAPAVAEPRTSVELPAEPAEPPPYRIGRDDILSITVYGQSDLDTIQTVRPDGKIEFPLAGEIRATGLTPAELRTIVSRELSRSFANPQVTVIVTTFGSRTVSVVGQVEKPGVYSIGAQTRLLDAIALAGGLGVEADLSRAAVVRNGQALPVDIEGLVRGSDLSQNILVGPGDTIVIPNAQDRRVVVLGNVVMPTVVSLRDKLTVLEAIAMAKGFAPGAARGDVLVVRGTRENPELFRIDTQDMVSGSDPAQNVELRAGDVIYVSKSTWKNTVELFQDFQAILEPARSIAGSFWFFATGLDVIQNPRQTVTIE
jgi:polysaccharide export outer membrane protein